MSPPGLDSVAVADRSPHLVEGRGELPCAVSDALRSGGPPRCAPGAVLEADPWGEDLQFALCLLYELHYRGFDGVDDALLVEPIDLSGSPGHHLETEGEFWQLREYAALRSLYHLKEADPHACVIPWLTGRAKAAVVAIEYDEFGAGRAERIHAQLFADLTSDLRLDPMYGRYLHRRRPERAEG